MAFLDGTGLTRVWNRVVALLNTKAEKDHTHTSGQVSGLSKVATTNNYNDLNNKPTIPTVPTFISELTNDRNFVTELEVKAMIESMVLNGYLQGYRIRVVNDANDRGDTGYLTINKG